MVHSNICKVIILIEISDNIGHHSDCHLVFAIDLGSTSLTNKLSNPPNPKKENVPIFFVGSTTLKFAS